MYPNTVFFACVSIGLLSLAMTSAASEVDADERPKSESYHPSIGSRHSNYKAGLLVSVGVAPGIDKRTSAGVSQSLNPKVGGEGSVGIFHDTSLSGGWGLADIPSLYFREVRGTSTASGVWSRDQLKSFGFRLGVGPSLTLGAVNLELTPFGGIGLATDRIETVSGGIATRKTSGNGNVFDYGITLNAKYLLEDNIFLGLSGGYDAFKSHVGFRKNAAPKEELAGGGPLGEFILGFWF